MNSTNSTTNNFLDKKEIDELKVIKRRKLTNEEEVKIYHGQQNTEESKDGSSEESVKTVKEELSQTKNSSTSQLPQKRKSGYEKEEPLIKYIFFKSLALQALKHYKKRLEDNKMQWPFLPEECKKIVQFGDKIFSKADKLDNLSDRYLLYLSGAVIHLRASHTLDEASVDARALYVRIASRLKSLKECYRMASEITTKEKVIYILGLRCLSAIHERLLILWPTETPEDKDMTVELMLSSHLVWISANEESNNECDEFFAQVSTDVGYKLEQQSCIRELITFVESSIKKLSRMN